MRKLIRVDGTEYPLDKKPLFTEIENLIGATCLDMVVLAEHYAPGVHVMCVDDTGADDGKPVNPKATELYWQKCGGPVDWCIHGDVVILPDSDYE
jgi:hypothetical protein